MPKLEASWDYGDPHSDVLATTTTRRESVGVSILSVCRTGATMLVIMLAYKQCTVDDTKARGGGGAATALHQTHGMSWCTHLQLGCTRAVNIVTSYDKCKQQKVNTKLRLCFGQACCCHKGWLSVVMPPRHAPPTYSTSYSYSSYSLSFGIRVLRTRSLFFTGCAHR